jgi:hypothetical protein
VPGNVVEVKHSVLNGNQDRIATRVIKVLHFVYESFNDDLGSTQALDGSDSLLFGSIGGSVAKILNLSASGAMATNFLMNNFLMNNYENTISKAVMSKLIMRAS